MPLLGGVAQLVERPPCTRKVSGSIPLTSTNVLCELKKIIKIIKKLLVIFEMFVIARVISTTYLLENFKSNCEYISIN